MFGSPYITSDQEPYMTRWRVGPNQELTEEATQETGYQDGQEFC